MIPKLPISLWVEIFLVLLAALLAFAIPNQVNSKVEVLAHLWKRIAANPKRCLLLAFAIPVLCLAITVPIYPIPQPMIHDEFSHLLAADTLLHGRLANPPHPLWRHFETMHVIFNPAYASKYPVGQGAALAIPQIFGLEPHWGVWLALGGMTAAVCWMLQNWVSRAFALYGAVLIMPRLTLFSYWSHSYWGGAVPAIGGALALGGFVRMMKQPAPKYAWLFGAGMFISANSRPYESAVLASAIAVAFLRWIWRDSSYRKLLPHFAAIALIIVGFTALHNYRVTGDPLKLPYQRNRELYGTPQSFYWQKPVPMVPSEHALLNKNQQWQLEQHELGQSFDSLLKLTTDRIFELWLSFAAPLWTPALLFVPWLSPRYRLPLAGLALVMIATLLYPFSFSHYYGPVAGIFILIVVSGLQRVRQLKLFGKPAGAAFCSILMISCPATYALFIATDINLSRRVQQPKRPRTQLVEALQKMGGSHVVFVHYFPDHDFNNEFVYNAADIDASDIVWARNMSPRDNAEVIRYYKGRRFWIFEPDAHPPRLNPYPAEWMNIAPSATTP